MKLWIVLSLIMFSLGTSLVSHGASINSILEQSSDASHHPGQDEKSESSEFFDMELEEDCIIQAVRSSFTPHTGSPEFPDHLRPYLAYLEPEEIPPKN